MIDGIDLLSLEVSIRDIIGEETAKFWTQAQVRRAINSEVARMARKVIDLDAGYFETSASFFPAATIALPINCYVVRNIEAYVNGMWQGIRWINDTSRGQYQAVGAGSSGSPLAVRFAENSLVFYGGIGGAAAIRIQYARSVASLISCAVVAATTGTVQLAEGSVHDDIYVGDRVVVTSGIGLGQVRTVSGYAAATMEIAVDDWSVIPDETGVITWALPDPLHKWADVVSLGAAIRLVGRRRDTEMHSVLSSQYGADLEDMMNSLKQRQTDQPQRVNYLPDGLE